MSTAHSALPRFYHCHTDVGRFREINEDSHAEFALGDGSILLVVADGMGGHAAGEVASRIAVEAIGHIVQNSPAPDPREKLRNGFLVANQRILAAAESSGATGMGTTAVAAYVRQDQAYVVHVGDSRLYHIRKGQLVERTLDHTRVQKMVSMGILPASAAKQHPDANVVTRALGHARLADGSILDPEVAEQPWTLRLGDSLVLCSDGLYDDVEDAEIAQQLGGRSAAEAARALVDLANQRGGHDNITVTVLHYGAELGAQGGAERSSPAARLPERRLLSALVALGGLGLAVLALGLYLRGRGGEGHVPKPHHPAAAPGGAGGAALPPPAAREQPAPAHIPDLAPAAPTKSAAGAPQVPVPAAAAPAAKTAGVPVKPDADVHKPSPSGTATPAPTTKPSGAASGARPPADAKPAPTPKPKAGSDSGGTSHPTDAKPASKASMSSAGSHA